MKLLFFRILGLSVLLLAALFYGMTAQRFKLPPYDQAKAIYKLLVSAGNTDEQGIAKKYIEIAPEHQAVDVDDLISIRSAEDVVQKRDDLIELLWGNPGLPARLPASIERNVTDPSYEDIASLYQIDRLEIEMDEGLDSNVYHFLPKSPGDKVVIYHQGHRGDFIHGKKTIRQLLDHGYNVVALSMPLHGPNNKPTIDDPRLGRIKITQHSLMRFLQPEHGYPLKYLIEPVVIVLNYLEKSGDFASVSMIGISGGGWTTVLAAAIDPRIEKSFPVAGSYPIYLKAYPGSEWGDYEERDPVLYRTVNYLELYILGASGSGRKQLQIINQFDSCCYGGIKWRTYKDTVAKRVRNLGDGEFDIVMDDSHRNHIISRRALDTVLWELRND